ncbi:hypothetical protein ACN38_g8401 [Penicillium nordicum]|uniref:Uncharacterized protein n=1 Tax=Penicillium nordicum TaxID=229535 RepID=A0A0M8P5D6_9EURO|nr:hypothetical protein ACN38_g8401 [Penicillium nordicum]
MGTVHFGKPPRQRRRRAHGVCTSMLRRQHYSVAESHTIYSMPTRSNTSSRASPSVKSWLSKHLGSIAIGGPTEYMCLSR